MIRSRRVSWPLRGGAVAMAGIWLLPLYWMVSASLRMPGTRPARSIEWLPANPSLLSYDRLPDTIPLARLFANSLLVAGFAVPMTLLTASWAGFAMSLMGPRRRRAAVVGTLLLLLIPGSALWLPRFVLFAKLNLIDTFWALVIPACMGSSPLFVLLFYWTYRRVPREVFEAGQLDGAGHLRLWAALAVPLSRPMIATVAVLAFAMYWSDFVSPLLYLKSEQRYPLAVGMNMLQQLDRTNWPLLMAGAVVMCVPVLLGFILIQRYFWSGIDTFARDEP